MQAGAICGDFGGPNSFLENYQKSTSGRFWRNFKNEKDRKNRIFSTGNFQKEYQIARNSILPYPPTQNGLKRAIFVVIDFTHLSPDRGL